MNILFLYYAQIGFLFYRKHNRITITIRIKNEIWISQSVNKISYFVDLLLHCGLNVKGWWWSSLCIMCGLLRFQWFRQPEHFFFGLERTVAVRCTPHNAIADRMNSCMASQLRRVLNTTPVNFIVDHFFAYIIKTIVGQLNFPLLTGHIIQRYCWVAWFCLKENRKREERKNKTVFG